MLSLVRKDNYERFVELARGLDEQHGTGNALTAYAKMFGVTADYIHTTCFEKKVVVHHTVNEGEVFDRKEIVARMGVDERNKEGELEGYNADRIFFTYKVVITEEELTTIDKDISKLIRNVVLSQTDYVRRLYMSVIGLVDVLKKDEFQCVEYIYTPGKEFNMMLSKGNIIIKLSLWLDDASQLVI